MSPRLGLFQLRGHLDEQIFPPVGGSQLASDGQPALFHQSGSEMAGWPVTLKGAVSAPKVPSPSRSLKASCAFGILVPMRGGDTGSVGVNSKSACSHHCAISRVRRAPASTASA